MPPQSSPAGGTGGTGGTGDEPTCTTITVGPDMYLNDIGEAPDFAAYLYETSPLGAAGDLDLLNVLFYASTQSSGYDGEDKGIFQLGTGIDANFETCARCVLVEQDYDSTLVIYFATAGTLDVATTSDQMNGAPQATLTGVTLREVTIDSTVSTLVPNGRCLQLAAAVVQLPPTWTCSNGSYASDDGCDCGCGARDGDCTDAAATSCDTCHCASDTSDCSAVVSIDNAICAI